MQLVVERCAGLDVHRDVIVACVRTPGRGRTRTTETQRFTATTTGLRLLRGWLAERKVTVVGMESTGVYWRPAFTALEDIAECQVLNAGHMRPVPGRKTSPTRRGSARSPNTGWSPPASCHRLKFAGCGR